MYSNRSAFPHTQLITLVSWKLAPSNLLSPSPATAGSRRGRVGPLAGVGAPPGRPTRPVHAEPAVRARRADLTRPAFPPPGVGRTSSTPASGASLGGSVCFRSSVGGTTRVITTEMTLPSGGAP